MAYFPSCSTANRLNLAESRTEAVAAAPASGMSTFCVCLSVCVSVCVCLCVCHFYYPYISVSRRVLLEPVILSVCAWKNLCFILSRRTFPAAPASVFHCSKCPLHFVCACLCVFECVCVWVLRESVRRHPRTPDQSRLFTRRQIPVNFILKIALQYVHSPRNGPDYNWRLTSELPLLWGVCDTDTESSTNWQYAHTVQGNIQTKNFYFRLRSIFSSCGFCLKYVMDNIQRYFQLLIIIWTEKGATK